MEISRSIYIYKRTDWRQWLSDNFESEPEIWLIIPQKSSGKPALIYNDAVEEALCFGWIDSIVKSFDADSKVQRYSPRIKKRAYSQTNIERLRFLAANKLIHPKILSDVQEAINSEFHYPGDILLILQSDKTLWKNFCSFSEPYKRIRVAYVDSARKMPDEFNKRLANFIEKTAQNKQFGYGGIEKYF